MSLFFSFLVLRALQAAQPYTLGMPLGPSWMSMSRFLVAGFAGPTVVPCQSGYSTGDWITHSRQWHVAIHAAESVPKA
jgi:hypothetical protein